MAMNNHHKKCQNQHPAHRHCANSTKDERSPFTTAELLAKCMARHENKERIETLRQRCISNDQMREARERFVRSLHEDNRRLQTKITRIRSRMESLLKDMVSLRDNISQQEHHVDQHVRPERRGNSSSYLTQMNNYRRSGC